MALLENGLRKVPPYYHKYRTHVKERWFGRTVADVLTAELGQSPVSVKSEIAAHRTYVAGNFGRKGGETAVLGWSLLQNRLLQNHDVLYTTSHVHEPSVPAPSWLQKGPLKYPSQKKLSLLLLHESDSVLVVDKPAGIPTHPTGNYRHNSVTEIIKHDLQLDDVWPCHRLDKGTSGVLILALNSTANSKYLSIINKKKHLTSKLYVARVTGRFPANPFTIRCPVFSVNASGAYLPSNITNIPLDSATLFERITYNEDLDQSVILCKPRSGRMHQIRIHLRNLGYPIANDGMYNPPLSDVASHIRNEVERELYKRLFERQPDLSFCHKTLPEVTEKCIDVLQETDFNNDSELQEKLSHMRRVKKTETAAVRAQFGQKCPECGKELYDDDRDVSEDAIWLHAFSYTYENPETGESFAYTADKPSWCSI